MSAQAQIIDLTDQWKAAILTPATVSPDQEPLFIRAYHGNRQGDDLVSYARNVSKGLEQSPVVVVMVNDNEARVTAADVKRVFKERAPSVFA